MTYNSNVGILYIMYIVFVYQVFRCQLLV